MMKITKTRNPDHSGSRASAYLAVLIMIAGLLVANNALPQSGGFMNSYEVEKIGDGLYTFRYGPYRNIFLIGDEGVIVTDPLKVVAAEALRKEIAKITDKPIRYVAYSHSHWDHVVGGEIFKREGAIFVAQEICGDNFRETPRSDLITPDIVFSDSVSLSVGNRSLEMHYFGPNHGNCLAVMVAKPANIAFIVDLANPPTGWHLEWNPTIPDTYIWNLIPSLTAIEEFARAEGITQFVGGHMAMARDANGKMSIAPAVGSIAAVTERRLFWEMVIAEVSAESASGTVGELMASKLDRGPLEARIAEHDPDDMSILLRRIASYVFTGW